MYTPSVKLDNERKHAKRPNPPQHRYVTQYIVRNAPSTGKPGYMDIILVRRASVGSKYKDHAEIVRAWRNRRSGDEAQSAFDEAHALRDELDLAAAYKERK